MKKNESNKENLKSTVINEVDFLIKHSELPELIKKQFEIINSLQNRVNELNKDFEIEKNCKNDVYSFILTQGYFDEYLKFDRTVTKIKTI